MRRSLSRRRHKKVETGEKKEKSSVKIPDDMKISENKRCSKWDGNWDDCKANNCFFYKDSKKCKINTFYVADKLKGISKKRSKKHRSSKKSSKKSSRKSSRKNRRRKSRR